MYMANLQGPHVSQSNTLSYVPKHQGDGGHLILTLFWGSAIKVKFSLSNVYHRYNSSLSVRQVSSVFSLLIVYFCVCLFSWDFKQCHLYILGVWNDFMVYLSVRQVHLTLTSFMVHKTAFWFQSLLFIYIVIWSIGWLNG